MQKALTIAETKVLRKRATTSAKETAYTLSLSENTANNHFKSIKSKIGLFKDVEIAFLVAVALCGEKYEVVKEKLESISVEDLREIITRVILVLGFIFLSLHIQFNDDEHFTRRNSKTVKLSRAKRSKETI